MLLLSIVPRQGGYQEGDEGAHQDDHLRLHGGGLGGEDGWTPHSTTTTTRTMTRTYRAPDGTMITEVGYH